MVTRGASVPRTGARAKKRAAARTTAVDSGSTYITIVTCALLLLGLVMILSASFVHQFTNEGSSFLYSNDS